MAENKENYIFGLDIGSSKIDLFMGDASEGRLSICENVRIELDKPDEMDYLTEKLKELVRDFENLNGTSVHEVYVGIAGKNVLSRRSNQSVPLETDEVRASDIEKIKRLASVLPESAGEIIHVFPIDYSVDDQEGIRNPKGLTGRRLGIDLQIVTVASNTIKNLTKCIKNAGLEIAAFVLEPLADACAVLTEDERELGVALIDIGASSSDVAVFVGDSVRYTTSLDYAGNIITRDITKCLKTPISYSKAEEVKKKHGTCKITNLIDNDTFPVPGVGNRGEVSCSRKFLAQVITARVAEIFKLIREDLSKHDMLNLINGGIVLTGGSCALEGIDELATKVFDKPARIGHSHGTGGIQEAYSGPSYATGVGLLHYASVIRKSQNRKSETGKQISVSVKNGFQRVKKFLQTYF